MLLEFFSTKETAIVRTAASSIDNLPSNLFFRKQPQKASTYEQHNETEERTHNLPQVGTSFECVFQRKLSSPASKEVAESPYKSCVDSTNAGNEDQI